MNTNTYAPSSDITANETLRARVLAAAAAVVIVFTVGFAQSATLHNAAHDTRHTLAFPCH